MTTDVKKTDEVLDRIQLEFEGLSFKYDLTNKTVASDLTIERWRWDEPTINMSWLESKTGVRKSLQVTVLETGLLALEINAWKDFDVSHDQRIRRWRNQQTEEEFPIQSMTHPLFRAFDTISGWTEADLTKESEIGV